MGEHVGQANYPAYVEVMRAAVKPGGRVLLQQMSRSGRHPGGGPFIESFIAPDRHMRPVGETVGLIEAGGIRVWRLYLVGGWMAFRDGRLGVDQVLAIRPGPHTLPAVRAW